MSISYTIFLKPPSPIGIQCLQVDFGKSCSRSSGLSSTWARLSTRKWTVSLSVSTNAWKSICVVLSMPAQITRVNSFHWLSFGTSRAITLPWTCHRSMPYMATNRAIEALKPCLLVRFPSWKNGSKKEKPCNKCWNNIYTKLVTSWMYSRIRNTLITP